MPPPNDTHDAPLANAKLQPLPMTCTCESAAPPPPPDAPCACKSSSINYTLALTQDNFGRVLGGVRKPTRRNGRPDDADDAPPPPPHSVIFCNDALARKLAFRHSTAEVPKTLS